MFNVASIECHDPLLAARTKRAQHPSQRLSDGSPGPIVHERSPRSMTFDLGRAMPVEPEGPSEQCPLTGEEPINMGAQVKTRNDSQGSAEVFV